jgi:UDP-glucose 4-epimerase
MYFWLQSMGVKKMIITLSAVVRGNNLDMPEYKSMLPEPASPYAPSLSMFLTCARAGEDFVIYEDSGQAVNFNV